MSQKPYTVLVTLEAKPGKEKELQAVLSSLIAPSLKEAGCINYDLHKSPTNPRVFMFYENWSSKEAHNLHCETSHFTAAKPAVENLTTTPVEASFWEKI